MACDYGKCPFKMTGERKNSDELCCEGPDCRAWNAETNECQWVEMLKAIVKIVTPTT